MATLRNPQQGEVESCEYTKIEPTAPLRGDETDTVRINDTCLGAHDMGSHCFYWIEEAENLLR